MALDTRLARQVWIPSASSGAGASPGWSSAFSSIPACAARSV